MAGGSTGGRCWARAAILPLVATALGAAMPPLGPVCDAAAAVAEQQAGLPPHLLTAIGRVEAGRRNTLTGLQETWPWTINAAGQGSMFGTANEAISSVQALLAHGVRSIDVGCFQVNLAWHPDAFASIAEAFDPSANARAAAGLLIGLQHQTGDWGSAIARYHSATDGLGVPYRSMVFAAWAALGSGTTPWPTDPFVVRMSQAALSVHVFYGAIPTSLPGQNALSTKTNYIDQQVSSETVAKSKATALRFRRLN